MSRRRASNSESLASSSSMNEAFAYPFSSMQQNHQPPRRGPIEGPNGRRLIRRVTWRSSTYKLMASLWVLGVFYIVWLIRDIFYLPFSPSQTFPITLAGPNHDFLAEYAGHRQCGLSSLSLFEPPQDTKLYCQTRDSLLNAMSNGGRHGFDAAYTSQGCSYRWFSVSQVCDVLQKFDGVVFIGDESLADIYAGFNILLRQNLESGSLKDWEFSKDQAEKCKCDSQFTSPVCAPLRITSSDQAYQQDGPAAERSPYRCSTRVSHGFVPITGSPASKNAHETFRLRVSQATGKSRPVPVIHSLSLSTSHSLSTARSSMDEWLESAQSSGRDMPFLWVGPNSPGHQNSPGDNVRARSWQYTLDASDAARGKGVESLGMYNATLQADSWDGVHYGEKVAVMQAMMILNWLAAL
ncbi:hypothetical protein P168DRAFT_312551 [Aspergillus campestris IBT 28561]|uniref:Uncharacterized protein n=1 Tax=Aspergillus campestris (strain IBT 28561) TaxID=1392248 RepID=A0A2I1CUW7_ASPC2|nr:uncharacterized protein P168DRAFT_312551 [Aspergillus campestris IBT 28561]PKY01401.1 hypothetical protein P168DRAFT_312551 [Aspergillus campestris IBT 28561]